MRLLSLTVRNYRVHQDLTVSFDPARNLIGGPNESGKSTLAEAAHRALFLRAKTGGQLQKDMVSTRHLGTPEVVLIFEAAGCQWELEKRFSGPSGSTRLSAVGGATLRDDEAESRLSELLRSETATGRGAAGQLPLLWSHLWVWQGTAVDDPSTHATRHRDTLVQRLQKDGFAAVMQSANDQRVAERIAAEYGELFTGTGRPKAGSRPELARQQLEEAEAALQKATDTAARLEQAVQDHARADREIAEADTALPELREKLAQTETALARVAELRREEETRLLAVESAAARLEQISRDDRQIRDLSRQAEIADQTLLPAEKAVADLVAAEQSARAESGSAQSALREAAEAVRQARIRHDLAAAVAAAFEKAESHQRLAARAAEAETVRAEIAQLRASLASLPDLSAKDLAQLRKLDREASQAAAALEAMATGIELLSASDSVTLDGAALAPGESRILTADGELAIGDGTRLRIRPGGGASLTDSRRRSESAHGALAAALDSLALRDLDHAAASLEQRQSIEQRIAQADTRWNALGGEALTPELATATAELEAANAEVTRRREFLAGDAALSQPDSLAAARRDLAIAQEALTAAEKNETAARRLDERLRTRLDEAGGTLQRQKDELTTARQARRDLETKIRLLEDAHGDSATRGQAMAEAREESQRAGELLAATRRALAELEPDLLAADRDRFTRAISQQESRRREAENQRLIARDRLTLDGSSDPDADLSHAHARREATRDIHATELRRARAIERLHHLFSSSREAIDRSLVQPLADRIVGYLQCLFGPGTEVRVNLSDSGIEGIELVRPGEPVFHFSTLSGGAREQVAAATRLAMAEILAADHDGCLPILFDDAFAYTDPERVQSLQRMLNLAALRGLQVFVLTCAPADYAAFGAKTISLA
jgi:DNA repair exonuclease SbcCD ATPase subunit